MRRSTQSSPPPVIDYSRLLSYAYVDKSVGYAGRTLLFVEGNELGRVPRLAICENQKVGILLLHCNRKWKTQGVSGHDSVVEAKKKAESIYPGISKRWINAHVTKMEARKYLEKMWGNERCNFCRKYPHEVRQLFGSVRALICDECMDKFNRMMAEQEKARNK
jgi:hypothetical protein